MKQFSKTLSWLAAVLLIAFVVIMTTWVTPLKSVRTGSMVPTLPVGSRILIHEEASYHAGEHITFHADGGEVVTHRLVKYRPDGSIVTKGDANPTPDNWDDPVTKSDLMGRVIYMTPITTPAFWGSPRGIGVIICLTVMVAALLWWTDESRPSGARRKSSAPSPA